MHFDLYLFKSGCKGLHYGAIHSQATLQDNPAADRSPLYHPDQVILNHGLANTHQQIGHGDPLLHVVHQVGAHKDSAAAGEWERIF